MIFTVTNKIAQFYSRENHTVILKAVQDKATKTTNAKYQVLPHVLKFNMYEINLFLTKFPYNS